MSECHRCHASLSPAQHHGGRCAWCCAVSYCNSKCQDEDWPSHETFCREQAQLLINSATSSPHLLRNGGHSPRKAGALQAAVDEGDATAMNALGVLYSLGQGGLPTNAARAAALFTAAVDAPSPPIAAFNNLAVCYKFGRGVDVDLPRAVELWARGADAGDPECMAQLGECLQRGEGTELNPEAAFMWLHTAAEAGHPVAQCKVGFALDTGFGVPQDSEKAVHYYRLAATQGDAAAMFNLGRCYADGSGVPKDPLKFITWLQRAKLAGHPSASRELDEHASRLPHSALSAHWQLLKSVLPFNAAGTPAAFW